MSDLRCQESALAFQNSELRTQNPELTAHCSPPPGHSALALLFLATFLTALFRGLLISFFAATGTALLAAAGFFIHRGPGAALSFLLGYALLLVAFFNVFSFTFLFAGVTTLVSSRHRSTSLANLFSKQRAEKSPEREMRKERA